jgi:hypothetical protein
MGTFRKFRNMGTFRKGTPLVLGLPLFFIKILKVSPITIA